MKYTKELVFQLFWTIVVFWTTILIIYITKLFIQRRVVRKALTEHSCEPCPQYPHIDGILGLDLTLEMWTEFNNHDFSEGMRRRHTKYGPTFQAISCGNSSIYTVNPENIRTVTTSRFDDYVKSSWVQEARKHIGNGVFTTDGDQWKRSRTLLEPMFARTSSNKPALLEPHIEDLFLAIRQHDSKHFDFGEIASRFFLDVMTEVFCYAPTDCLKGRDERANRFLQCFHEFDSVAASFIALGPLAYLVFFLSRNTIMVFVEGMQRFFKDKIWDGHVDHPPAIFADEVETLPTGARPNFLRMMDEEGLPRDQIQAEVQNIFFAAHGTTTALLSNLFDAIGSRPSVQLRLRKDFDALQGRCPSAQDLSNMQYLRWTILETLRLSSPLTLHSRKATKDTILPAGGGASGASPVFVPKGAEVIWSTCTLNRSSEIFGNNSLEFEPERWAKAPLFEGFMPFGLGPRSCLGQHMAISEVSYVTVRLLQAFSEISIREPHVFKEAKAGSYHNANGTIIQMSR